MLETDYDSVKEKQVLANSWMETLLDFTEEPRYGQKEC